MIGDDQVEAEFPRPRRRVGRTDAAIDRHHHAGAAGMFCGSCMRDNTLVNALHAQGHLAEAEEAYRAILDRDPDNAEVGHQLGLLALDAGMPQHAAPIFERVCLLVPAKVWSRLGGFDEGFPMYFEDFDLSLRAKDPASLVIIVVALTLALGASGADLVRHRHDARPANGALVAGAGLMMFSLFGLAWGIASLGLCGFFVAASGLPLRQRTPGPGEVMDQEARRR